MPFIEIICLKCRTSCRGDLTGEMILEGDMGDLVCEEWTCPSCGEELHMHVGALVHGDEADESDLVDEGCEFDGFADDI